MSAGREASGAGFPWEAAMAAGFGLLRLSPAAFWAMTPRELSAALGPFVRAMPAAPARADLADLMRRFPDIARGRTDGP